MVWLTPTTVSLLTGYPSCLALCWGLLLLSFWACLLTSFVLHLAGLARSHPNLLLLLRQLVVFDLPQASCFQCISPLQAPIICCCKLPSSLEQRDISQVAPVFCTHTQDTNATCHWIKNWQNWQKIQRSKSLKDLILARTSKELMCNPKVPKVFRTSHTTPAELYRAM